MNRPLYTLLIFFIIGSPVRSQDTIKIYLDSSYSDVKKSKAVYLCETIIENNLFRVSIKNMAGNELNYCEFKSIKPVIREGKARFYYEPGILQAIGNYKDGQLSGKWFYYQRNQQCDTLDYTPANDFMTNEKQNGFPNKQVSRADQNLERSITNEVYNQIHLPARLTDSGEEIVLKLRFILDTTGRIRNLRIKGSQDEDIKLEVYRAMLLYHNQDQIHKPQACKIEIRYNESPYSIAEEMPEFPIKSPENNQNNFQAYLLQNLHFPSVNRKGTIYFQYTVNKTGGIEHIKILRVTGLELTEQDRQELERVIYHSPKWVPGKQDGIVVNVEFTQTILVN